MKQIATLLFCLGMIFAVTNVSAQVAVSDAWVRATVAQQKSTGAFFQIKSMKKAKLISVSTPHAAMAEIHEMSMDNNVMKMREMDVLELPAGKQVELKPGGFHIMLMGLKKQAKVGDEVTLSLTVEDLDKKRQVLEVKAKVRAINMSVSSAM
jgi:copper(I)-binding protein